MSCNCGGGNRTKVTGHTESYNLLHVIRDELLNKAEYVDDNTKEARIALCNDCDNLVHLTRQCKRCGCFIDVKAKYAKAFCPIGRWSNTI